MAVVQVSSSQLIPPVLELAREKGVVIIEKDRSVPVPKEVVDEIRKTGVGIYRFNGKEVLFFTSWAWLKILKVLGYKDIVNRRIGKKGFMAGKVLRHFQLGYRDGDKTKYASFGKLPGYLAGDIIEELKKAKTNEEVIAEGRFWRVKKLILD